MKSISSVLISFAFLLTACGGGGSDSGGAVDITLPGDMLPANFIGTYTGTINLTASAAGLSESDSSPITIVVAADGTLTFMTDDPEERVTVGVENSGAFSGSITLTEDPCSGTVNVVGSVDGTTASGTVSGEGTCNQDGLSIDVDLSGDFSATK